MEHEPQSSYQWWANARAMRKRQLDLSDYEKLPLDAAIAIGFALAREATFHIASWNRIGYAWPFLYHLSGVLSSMETVNDDAVSGMRTDILINHTRELFEQLGRVGSTALYARRNIPAISCVGARLEDIGQFVSTTTDLLPSQVRPSQADYLTVRDGYNKIAADVLLNGVSLGSGSKLSEEFLFEHARLRA